MHEDTAHCDLFARDPGAFHDLRTQDTVRATAEALAERTGTAAPNIEFLEDRVRFFGAAGDVTLLGLVAEVRAITQRWHRKHHGAALWQGDDE
ncbi:MAG: hypothetical protein DWI11_00725 [Planctomycetota bacterium]|nr:MAG: hypothetical protein DWI11_00725 [Planctomycetota bacterium]